jgi:protein phosphatase PTC2/3
LSEDHKPSNTHELKRIQSANHIVEDNRVDGTLALSRALGDFRFKDQIGKEPNEQAVTCNPDIKVFDRN